MQAERQPKMRAMIMAETEDERRAALEELLPLQRADFEGLFEAMEGLPVTIRLLDPPLHEFLPNKEELLVELERAQPQRPARRRIAELERAARRGCASSRRRTRCSARAAAGSGSCIPEIYEMQVRAIVGAALGGARAHRRRSRSVEIMIPLVDYEHELELMRALVERSAARGDRRCGAEPISYHGRHDDRAAARLPGRRPDRRVTPTSSASAPTT